MGDQSPLGRPGPRVVFFDPLCPAPYTRQTLETGGLGGSEASVVRIAEALDALVMQHCRRDTEGRYLPPMPLPGVEHVVVLRDPRALRNVRPWFPRARFHVWLHDRFEPGSTRARWLAQAGAELAGTTLICVSDWLRRNVDAVIGGLRGVAPPAARVIFNPIGDDLAPSGDFDRDQLVFLSSPNKGLDYALLAFAALRRALPGLRLAVANPGYRLHSPRALPGVEWLGVLSPARAVAAARSSLCVFAPNFVLPETFGLVFAEANAVGTPVLAHDCGAAREVLHTANPVLPVRMRQRCVAWSADAPWIAATLGRHGGAFDEYLELLRAWRSGQRPRVDGAARFRLSRVAQDWRALLS